MAFLGASSVSAATATQQERPYLSSSQEATKEESFGVAETLLDNGIWALREATMPRLLVYASRHSPLCLGPWPCSLQVQILPLLPSPAKLHLCHRASLGHPQVVPLSLFSLHLSFVWVLLPHPL